MACGEGRCECGTRARERGTRASECGTRASECGTRGTSVQVGQVAGIGAGGEETREFLAEGSLDEDLADIVQPVRFTQIGANGGEFFSQIVANQLGRDRGTVTELGAVTNPLPHLATGDLRGGRVLHQV